MEAATSEGDAVGTWTLRVGLAVAVLLAAGSALGTVVPGRPDWWLPVDSYSFVTSGFAVAACGLAAWRRPGDGRASWALLGMLFVCYLVGDGLWTVAGDLGSGRVAPTLADGFYLLALVPGTAGLLMFPAARGWRRAGLPLVLDVVLITVAVGLISMELGLDDIADGSTLTESLALFVYPLTDIVLVSFGATVLLRSVGKPRPDLLLVTASFAMFTVGDVGYALLTSRGEQLSGSLPDFAYDVAPVLMGVAGLLGAQRHRSARVLQRHLPGVAAEALPDLIALLALGLVTTRGLDRTSWGWGVLGVLLVLFVWRVVSVSHERNHLRADLERRVRQRTDEVRQLTEQQERLDSMKYSFVSSVSHELRTPLTAINGSLEMLADGDVGLLPPEAQAMVARALRGGHRLRALVDDIVEAERLSSSDFIVRLTEWRAADLLDEVVDSMADAARVRGVRLEVAASDGVVHCDGARIVQALINLVGNAVKFSEPHTLVSLGATAVDDVVRLTVSDQGRGIPAAELEAIFDRFHQVEADDARVASGAGIGLAITRSIVEAHGGQIWADSTVGVGSRFHLSLPRVAPTTDRADDYAGRVHSPVGLPAGPA